MNWIEIIQTALLIYLIERVSIVRNRYKLGIDHKRPDDCSRGWFSLWIFCRPINEHRYFKEKYLIGFRYGKS